MYKFVPYARIVAYDGTHVYLYSIQNRSRCGHPGETTAFLQLTPRTRSLLSKNLQTSCTKAAAYLQHGAVSRATLFPLVAQSVEVIHPRLAYLLIRGGWGHFVGYKENVSWLKAARRPAGPPTGPPGYMPARQYTTHHLPPTSIQERGAGCQLVCKKNWGRIVFTGRINMLGAEDEKAGRRREKKSREV